MKRFLVCIPDSKVGDFLMSVPTLAALRAHFPGCHIALLLRRPDPGEWLTRHPLIDDIIWCNPDDHTRRQGMAGVVRELRKRRFDVAIYRGRNAHFVWMFWLAGISMRIAGSNRYYKFLITHNTACNRETPDRHELIYNLEQLRPLGITAPDTAMRFPVSPQEQAQADALLREQGVRDGDTLIAINPGYAGSSRPWPAERFAEVGKRLAAEAGARILIVGRSGDAQMENGFCEVIGPACVDLTGKTSVPLLAAILQRCRLHISIDTGTSHLAAAMDTPNVTLFPYIKHWEQRVRWRPWQPESQQRLLGPLVRCAGCAQRCTKTENACVDSITVAQVVAAALDLLASTSDTRRNITDETTASEVTLA